MKKRRIVRGCFDTNDVDISRCTLSNLDSSWWIYFTYDDGSTLKMAPIGSPNATTEPVPVNTVTTSITVTPSQLLTWVGQTQQLTVRNEDGFNVITECGFVSSVAGKATISAGGLITVAATGMTYVRTIHPDNLTGTTSVTGYTYDVSTMVAVSATTTLITGATLATVLVNAAGQIIPYYENTYATSHTGYTTVNATTGLVTAVHSGVTSITATNKYIAKTAVKTITVVGVPTP